jgi:hypothetical protein
MKRKLALLVLVAFVALLAASPALAAGPRGGQAQQHRQGNYQGERPVRRSFSLVGVITAIEGSTITVEVYHGNRIGQAYSGEEVAVQVTDSTRYRQWAADGCTPIAFDDVEAGVTASIQGTVLDGIFTAQRVTVNVPCCTK